MTQINWASRSSGSAARAIADLVLHHFIGAVSRAIGSSTSAMAAPLATISLTFQSRISPQRRRTSSAWNSTFSPGLFVMVTLRRWRARTASSTALGLTEINDATPSHP